MTRDQRVIAIACAIEAATGLALLVAPAFVIRLLLGVEATGDVLPISRIAGVALISLATACWPRAGAPAGGRGPYVGMLIYNSLVAFLLAQLCVAGVMCGPLQWPAAVTHLILAVLLALGLAKGHRTGAA